MFAARRRPAKQPRGAGLLLAMFFMVLISLLAMAFLWRLPTQARGAIAAKTETQGSLVCGAGLQEGIETVEDHALNLATSTVPIYPTDRPNPSLWTSLGALDSSGGALGAGYPWKYAVHIYQSRAHANLYRVVSEARLKDQADSDPPLVTTVAHLMRDDLFTHVILGGAGPGNTTQIQVSGAGQGGPSASFIGGVHSNNGAKMKINVNSRSLPNPGPMFQNNVTGTGQAPTVANSNSFSSTQWNRLIQGGKNSVHAAAQQPILNLQGSNNVINGSSNSLLQQALNHNPAPAPNQAGVNVIAGGGIYIPGNVEMMTLNVVQPASGAAYQTITLNLSGDVTTTITYNAAGSPVGISATRHGRTISAPALPPGPTNGVIYVNGNIMGVQGTNLGNKTIAASSNIKLQNSTGGDGGGSHLASLVPYATNTGNLQATQQNNGLTLAAANNIIVHSSSGDESRTQTHYTLYANLVAGNQAQVQTKSGEESAGVNFAFVGAIMASSININVKSGEESRTPGSATFKYDPGNSNPPGLVSNNLKLVQYSQHFNRD